ncbi:18970_t:CDS:2, partial [Rhizophagus irregularis]
SNLGPNTITEPDTFPVTMFLPGGPKTRPLNIYLVETFLLKWSGKVQEILNGQDSCENNGRFKIWKMRGTNNIEQRCGDRYKKITTNLENHVRELEVDAATNLLISSTKFQNSLL